MAITNSTIDMTWTAATDNFGVVSYHIYQSTDNVVYTEIHSTDGVTYAYTAIGLSEGTKYYFKQTAKDAAGNESLYGNTVEATTLGEVGYTYLLDDYPGAVAAYSLRKLRTGVVQGIMVRRDSDDQLVDVRLYDDPSKSIDLLSTVDAGGTLGDWVGSNSAYVDTWYDQSGNVNEATTGFFGAQQLIVSSGTLITENGNSAINANGNVERFILPFVSFSNSTNKSVFLVAKTDSNTTRQRLINFRDGTSTKALLWIEAGAGVVSFSGNAYANRVEVTTTKTSQFLLSAFDAATNQSIFANASAGATNSLGGTNISSNSEMFMSLVFTGEYFSGNIQEIVFYESDQTSNRTAIEDNINSTYNIYVVTAEVDAQLIQADTDNVSDTVIEINGVRSSASDTAVANLISRNVTVITN